MVKTTNILEELYLKTLYKMVYDFLFNLEFVTEIEGKIYRQKYRLN